MLFLLKWRETGHLARAHTAVRIQGGCTTSLRESPEEPPMTWNNVTDGIVRSHRINKRSILSRNSSIDSRALWAFLTANYVISGNLNDKLIDISSVVCISDVTDNRIQREINNMGVIFTQTAKNFLHDFGSKIFFTDVGGSCPPSKTLMCVPGPAWFRFFFLVLAFLRGGQLSQILHCNLLQFIPWFQPLWGLILKVQHFLSNLIHIFFQIH